MQRADPFDTFFFSGNATETKIFVAIDFLKKWVDLGCVAVASTG